MYKLNKKGHAILEVEASLRYESATGPTWWRYFEEFKDERIFGTRCPECKRVPITILENRTFSIEVSSLEKMPIPRFDECITRTQHAPQKGS